uniref:Post-GPI attachment to proteins factor 2-like n=1 Tax=Rhabditophanes sp. KR3021 TaxID=114890 RepID=A0AC35TKM4_9BILA
MSLKRRKRPCPRWHIEEVLKDNISIETTEPIEGYNVNLSNIPFKYMGIFCVNFIAITYIVAWLSYYFIELPFKSNFKLRNVIIYGSQFVHCIRQAEVEVQILPSLLNFKILSPFPNYVLRLSILSLFVVRLFTCVGHSLTINKKKLDKMEVMKKTGLEFVDNVLLADHFSFHQKIVSVIPAALIFEVFCFAMVSMLHPSLDSKELYSAFFISFGIISAFHMVLVTRSQLYQEFYTSQEKYYLNIKLLSMIVYLICAPFTIQNHLTYANSILCSPLVTWHHFASEFLMIVSYLTFHISLMWDIKELDLLICATKADICPVINSKSKDIYVAKLDKQYYEAEKMNIKECDKSEDETSGISYISVPSLADGNNSPQTISSLKTLTNSAIRPSINDELNNKV